MSNSRLIFTIYLWHLRSKQKKERERRSEKFERDRSKVNKENRKRGREWTKTSIIYTSMTVECLHLWRIPMLIAHAYVHILLLPPMLMFDAKWYYFSSSNYEYYVCICCACMFYVLYEHLYLYGIECVFLFLCITHLNRVT